jgi:hypothetical protein
MRIVPLPANCLRPGQPVPLSLRDARGELLLAKGQMLATQPMVDAMLARGLWVDAEESEALMRSFQNKLDQMLRSNALLGQIASAQPTAEAGPAAAAKSSLRGSDLSGLVRQANVTLREPNSPTFLDGVMRLSAEVRERLDDNPDRMLLWLVHNAGRETECYSATHALLVATVCGLSARHVPQWTVPQTASLIGAALTMNVSMTVQQDLMAQQDQPPSAAQKAMIKGHAQASVDLLRRAGHADELWLTAVLHHHAAGPGPLPPRPLGQQLARLLQRADLFGARLSPRRGRRPLSAAGAAQVTYLDENKQPDEAGTALIKATGICPPGGMVQLASGEQGIVIRRGRLANQPVVASLIGKSGLPLTEPVIRNTAQPAHAIARTLAVHEVKMLVRIETVIGL